MSARLSSNQHQLKDYPIPPTYLLLSNVGLSGWIKVDIVNLDNRKAFYSVDHVKLIEESCIKIMSTVT